MPEQFMDDIEYLYDAAETGEHGCLLPKLDDPRKGDEDEGAGDD
jgi:hypothetical protein